MTPQQINQLPNGTGRKTQFGPRAYELIGDDAVSRGA
jgi:hypothetical protein